MQTAKKDVLLLALYAGEILLKNGAETYRVEDTITRLCKAKGFNDTNVFVTATGIFVSIDKDINHNQVISYIKRINSRGINLNKISKVNNFSREFVKGHISIADGMDMLRKINEISIYPHYIYAFFGGISTSFFALLFGGNMLEFGSAFITGILVTYVLNFLTNIQFPPFLTNICGGMIAGIMAIIFSSLHPSVQIDKVIIGSIMTMVPGVAITNAVHDSINGDLVSGWAKATEALIVACSIAFGVGFILKLWTIFF